MTFVLSARLRPARRMRAASRSTSAVRTVHCPPLRVPRTSSPSTSARGLSVAGCTTLNAPSKWHGSLPPTPRPPPQHLTPRLLVDPATAAVPMPVPPHLPRLPRDVQHADATAQSFCSRIASSGRLSSLLPLTSEVGMPLLAPGAVAAAPFTNLYQSVARMAPFMLAIWKDFIRRTTGQCLSRWIRAEEGQAHSLRLVRERKARAQAAKTLAAVLACHALPPTAGRAEALAALAAVRAHPSRADTATVLRAAEAFREESLLASLPRSALIALAQYLSLASTGKLSLAQAAETAAALGLSLDGYLRFLVRRRVAALQDDDQLLLETCLPRGGQALRAAARMRGMDLLPRRRTRKGQLRTALGEWIALHAEQRIAPTLLLLSLAVSSACAPAPTPPTHLAGLPACLHTLLVHTPGGLDAPLRSLF